MSTFSKTSRGLVLVTRPWPEAESFSWRIEERGFQTLVEPMLRIVPLPFPLPDPDEYAGLIFTSVNGVRALPLGLFAPDIPVYCTGPRTARESQDRGFSNVYSAKGDSAALGRLLDEHSAGGRLLHLRGLDMAGSLKAASRNIDELIAYKAEAVSVFSPECRAALDENLFTAASFFSRRTAESFLRIVKKENLFSALPQIKALCISDSVLECVRSYAWSGAYAAATPDATGVLDLLDRVCP